MEVRVDKEDILKAKNRMDSDIKHIITSEPEEFMKNRAAGMDYSVISYILSDLLGKMERSGNDCLYLEMEEDE